MKEEMVTGKLGHREGRYVIEMEGRDEELPVGSLIDEEKLRALVGTEVEVLYSEPIRIVVAVVPKQFPVNCYYILCYKPIDIWGHGLGPVVMPEVSMETRTRFAQQLLQEGIITERVHEKLTAK